MSNENFWVGRIEGREKRIALKTHLNSTSYEYRSEAQPERLENTHQNETVMDAAAVERATLLVQAAYDVPLEN